MLDPLESIFPIQYRITLVVLYFCVQGYRDWRKHPENPVRLREYVFLLVLVFLGMIYGIFHDLVTVSLSREYFVIGKGVGPDPDGFYTRVVWLAIRATYWLGLLVGVVYLYLNNPSDKYPQLGYRQLARLVFLPLAISWVAAAVCGGLFYSGTVEMLGPEEYQVLRHPERFQLVWGIHYGSYFGGLLGLVVGACGVVRGRKKSLAAQRATKL